MAKRQKKRAPKKPPSTESAPRKEGRPSDFRIEYTEQGRKLAELGATDREIAEFFDVAESTLYLWKHTHAEFSEALKVGKDTADNRVEQSLYRRAVGYSHDSVKIFMPAGAKEAMYAPFTEHVAPDTTACIFWLKNRRKQAWRDQMEHKHSGKVELPGALTQLSDAEIEERLIAMRREKPTD